MRKFISPVIGKYVKWLSIRTSQTVKHFAYSIYTKNLPLIILALIIFQFCWADAFSFQSRFNHNIPKLKRLLPIMLGYPIKERIISPTTQLAFTYSMLTNMPICVKAWQRPRAKADEATQIKYLLEGFAYNQYCAPGVYLGITYIKGLNAHAQTFQRGHLTVFPRKDKLACGEYAIVMKTLNKDWRLSERMYTETEPLANQEGMKFLAKEVAHFHLKARTSSQDSGMPDSIRKKLEFNRIWFGKSLEQLSQDVMLENLSQSQSDINIEAYRWIGDLMESACTKLKRGFTQRHDNGHIRRCHGDLKVANLWLKPASGKSSQRLLALDCIDFNPDFCHIDTLSDLAMLVVDLQLHLQREDKALLEVFISEYFKEMGENEGEVKSLFTYYCTEKALVCANVSIALDKNSERGIQYLSLADDYAKKLQVLLTESKEIEEAPQQTMVTEVASLAPTH